LIQRHITYLPNFKRGHVTLNTPHLRLIYYLWPPYGIGQAIIFLPCGFFLSFLFFNSSPNLSGRRSDVYHTSTHGVALVRIKNAGLKCAAHGSLAGNAGPKKSLSGHHRTTLSGYIFAIKECIDNRRKTLNSDTSSTCSQYGELRPTRG